MIELLIAAIFFALLALMLFYRLAFGPTLADRAIAGDAIEMLAATSLLCYALYSGRGIYLDISLVVAILGFIGTLLIAKYLEGSL
ncbi:MAG: cation:proton antiporter [Firmicutes bacterium]|nr:cation:proton antiporter [Bacillota bacterium]MBQ6123472.1 cation:proton antiporter [Clostridia bacterium]MBQ1344104.1 cation:proton antiporter [Bacillota bacterium]MBQ3286722.1 cation:proton antiporter [Bacillota bacterium]MBQ6607155.1 cation:proton antiporter [Bacillota bacterium]